MTCYLIAVPRGNIRRMAPRPRWLHAHLHVNIWLILVAIGFVALFVVEHL